MNLRFLDRLQPLGLFVARVALGAIMVAHGSTKVFGGLHKHAELVAGLGMPGWLGYVSAFAELLGGVLLILGLLTRFAALVVCIDLVVAIAKVHWKNGFTGQNNYQFPLAVAAIAFLLIFAGAGPISLDWVFGRGGGGGKK
ncbi:MAG TPA: DoxX family protein [Terriglobales bacterium]|nr:DoxX family protein [Terriglobales bacterium]